MEDEVDIINVAGFREDGRLPHELRKISCKLGVFSEPDGSAFIEQGLTKVLVAVYGPHQPKIKSKSQHDVAVINCQYSTAVFSSCDRKRRPRGDRKSTEMSLHLRQALSAVIRTDLYPRSQIDIYFEVLGDFGGNFSACINGATLALIDAGIPLQEYLCACTASIVQNNTTLVDVSRMEENIGGPVLTVACFPESGKIVFMDMSQRFHIDYLKQVLEVAIEGCKSVKKILDEVVRLHIAEVGSMSGWGKDAAAQMETQT
ncbi:exosome complex component RRP41 isoform X2 [Chrysoperla carnea]|uniref:exosome complex component RRP41 isoform X2 n=1 Tax=Chrysoperla carnea TaxID=189513 RepID=UPI001D061857|nr:exosome complex component RRP41 isoform X2 [Chrysoperla carnea]